MIDHVTLVLVEDTRLVAELGSAQLQRVPHFAVLGVAHSAAEAREMIPRLRPRVVLMDWQLGDGDGVELIAELRPTLPEVRWLVLSGYSCVDLLEQADRAGAHGVVDKTTGTREEVRRAIETLAAGGDYYCPWSQEMLRYLRQHSAEARALSPTQREILRRLARYHSRPEIAAALGVSQGTITEQIVRIARKLGFDAPPGIAAMVTTARAKGLLPRAPL